MSVSSGAVDDYAELPPPDIADVSLSIDLPPAYDRFSDLSDVLPTPGSELPPAYPINLPENFPIGVHDTPPIVKATEVEAHLRLLGAFWQLRQDVVSTTGTDTAWDALSEDERWVMFVSRAAWRFELWYTKLVCRPGRPEAILSKNEVPPLDVAMIWHAYFLNPLEYLEDGLVRTANLLKIGYFPLARITAAINPISMRTLDPPHEQTFTFEAFTGESFIFPVVVLPTETVRVRCPRCRAGERVPWYASDDKGFGQAGFSVSCKVCNFTFNKEAMGVRRFAEHIRTWVLEPKTPGEYLAGTAIDYETGLPDMKKAYFLNRKLLQFFDSVCKKPEQQEVAAIGDLIKWHMVHAEYCCRIGAKLLDNGPVPPRWGRVFQHYKHPGIFSIDLVGATLRQGAFIKEMVGLGWTRPGVFATDKTPLARSIARYHAWLDLIASNPAAPYVPTLDIDLVWHTNMLFSARYRSDTFKLVGKIPNHDDKVEENALADAFDDTARAWKARFGVPYSTCGCAQPTSGSVLKRVKGLTRKPTQGSRLPPADIQSLISSEGDSDSEDEATHPSEHYSVLVLNNRAAAQARNKRNDELRKAQEAARKAQEAAKKAAGKGKGQGATGAAQHVERIEPKAGHLQAFRKPRPGPEEQEKLRYSPFLIDGTSLAGGNCAAGTSGGICQIGGTAVFCTAGGRVSTNRALGTRIV